MGFARGHTTGRSEVFGALVAQVILARFQIEPVGPDLGSGSIDCSQFGTEAANARLGQEILNDGFRLVVVPLAKLVVADAPLFIDEIERWPEFIFEGAPDRVII